MKIQIVIILIFLFIVGCRGNLKKESPIHNTSPKTKENILINNTQDTNKEIDSISDFYFPLEIKKCDFWVKIYKKDVTYNYISYEKNRIVMSGKIGVVNDSGNIYLNFENSFNAQYENGVIFFQNYGNSMNEFEQISDCELKYVSLNKGVEITNKNKVFYNDKAYYLEQSKLYDESIYISEKIIKKFPERTVTYINLGDAYWGLKNYKKAKENYRIYTKQMKEKSREQKIPQIVLDRLQ